jgi:general secretion pathway protein D
MKTTLPILLLLFLASCSNTSPKFQPVEEPSAVTEAPKSTAAPIASAKPSPTNAAQSIVVQPPKAGEQFVLKSETAAKPAIPVTSTGIAPAKTNAPAPPPFGRTLPAQVAAPNSAEPVNPFAHPEQPRIPAPATTPAAAAGNAAPNDNDLVPAGMIDFRATPLDQVLQVYADFVGRTLLRPANLGAPQVSLTTNTPLTRREVIQALDTVLGMNGITMINVGDKFVKAVPQAQAMTEGAPGDDRTAQELPDFGQFVTHVVQLKYVKPSEIQAVLQPFAKMPNAILPIDSSQIIVLRDYTENVKRMLEMINRVDISVPSEFVSEVIPIKYSKAGDIADALNSLSGNGGTTTIGNQSRGTGRGTTGGRRGGMGGMNSGGYNSGGFNRGYNSVGPQAGPPQSFTSRLQQIVQKASASGSMEILGETKIIADERSNSLLVFASKQDMAMIKDVVSKLDVVLEQVLIETVILDVQMDNGWNLGVSVGQHPQSDKLGTVGGVNNNPDGGPLGTLSQFFAGSGGSNITGAFPASSGLSYFGSYKGDLDVALQAAASDSRVNVIQKPRILTTHATPGSIFIGSTVPYVTGSSYGSVYGAGNTYQQLQVGISLDVTPFINPDGLVVMQIDEQIDEISGSIAIQNVGNVPTTTSRSLSAEVAVKDGDTIILGGFMRNSSNKQNSGVPLLKDIPILGALFSSKSDTKERKELLVLMRPTVLKTPEIAALATAEEKKRMPGISQAEAENLELERKELEAERKRAAERKKAEELRLKEQPQIVVPE